jgi:invasion protein IalB
MSDFDASQETSRSANTTRTIFAIVIPVLIFIAGGATALIGERFLSGNGPEELRVIGFGDWRVVCPPKTDDTPNCSLTLEVVRDQVSLTLDNATLGSRLRVAVPHGVFLEPGLGFSVGDQPLVIHPFETCMPVGCFADVPLDTAMLELLRTNMNGAIVVVPASGSPVTIPYSLNGFADGYAALEDEQGRRNSIWSFLSR